MNLPPSETSNDRCTAAVQVGNVESVPVVLRCRRSAGHDDLHHAALPDSGSGYWWADR